MAPNTRRSNKRNRNDSARSGNDAPLPNGRQASHSNAQSTGNDNVRSNNEPNLSTSTSSSTSTRRVPAKPKHKNPRNGVRGIPSLNELNANNIFVDRNAAIQFLVDKMIIPNFTGEGEKSLRKCPQPACKGFMTWKDSRMNVIRCSSRKCPGNEKAGARKTYSPFKTTFFSGARNIPLVLHLGYCWLMQMNQDQTKSATGASTATIAAYFGYFRQLVSEMLDDDESNTKIGGPGIMVEIDESKFAKRKYHRGHRVGDTSWVFGGIQVTNVIDGQKKPYFTCVVADRTRETLEAVIREHIAEGSIIISDKWSAYAWLANCPDYGYFDVNHSETYKDPETGACTNTIEGKWNGIKSQIARRNRSGARIGTFLKEQMWRDLNVDNLWEAFLEALRTVRYLEEEGAFDENAQEALEEDFNEAEEIARGIMDGLERSILEDSSSSSEEEEEEEDRKLPARRVVRMEHQNGSGVYFPVDEDGNVCFD